MSGQLDGRALPAACCKQSHWSCAPPRCAAQVDYVAEVLKSYSIIQENQWNKGEM